ncbi:MAG: carboxymuconolactone decarboxylase family protein [Candidatus Methylomirabilis sp.]|nr:carboxymuconolactone decarboxylase family protein [Candidatus Methylomirabilis sp.]
MMPKQKLPIPFQQFTQLFPEAHAAYERLGGACHTAGPLEAKTRELIQLGMAIGIRSEGAVHAHVRKALEAGASPEEIRHAVLLGIPTLGWPRPWLPLPGSATSSNLVLGPASRRGSNGGWLVM